MITLNPDDLGKLMKTSQETTLGAHGKEVEANTGDAFVPKFKKEASLLHKGNTCVNNKTWLMERE